MTTLKYYISLLLLFFFNVSWEQHTISDKLTQLAIPQDKHITYLTEKGQPIGCDGTLECNNYDVAFYSVHIDTNRKAITIYGRTYNLGIQPTDFSNKHPLTDTIGFPGVEIFLAKSFKQTLIIIPDMYFQSYYAPANGTAHFPFRNGDFQVTFTISKATKLYFVRADTYVTEYDVDKLFNYDN